MPKAIWNGQTLAESNVTEMVDGNHYFPPDSLNHEFLEASSTTTVCGWKGTAHYYTLNVQGEKNPDAAWYYPTPKEAAAQIRDHVAFWKGVTVVDTPDQQVNQAGDTGACEL